MDVNGTRFKLILGEDDWLACVEPGEPRGFRNLYWDAEKGALSLRPQLSLFRPSRPSAPLTPADRRGAAADRFGNWYWIGHDERTLYWSPPGGKPRVFWEQTEPDCPLADGDFRAADNTAPPIQRLAGLTVTEHHYLVVGNVTGHGLLLFDLHAGGPPLQLRFWDATDIDFEPFDIAAAPGGGFWVLDRTHRAYWGLDRYFQMVTTAGQLEVIEEAETFTFRPADGESVVRPAREFPRGFAVKATDPISIVALPDGSVLILDRGSPPGASTVLRYRLADLVSGPTSLEEEVLLDAGAGVRLDQLRVRAHDIAYLHTPDRENPNKGKLYAVEEAGKQVIAFDLTYAADTMSLAARVDYLPLHLYGGRAIGVAPPFAPDASVFADLAPGDIDDDSAVRWVAVRPFDQPRHVRRAEVILNAPSRRAGSIPALDSGEHDCVWHRLFLDGCLPPETGVAVWSRASNNLEDIEGLPFLQDPTPYLRPTGAELPFYRPFVAEDATMSPTPAGLGTWETLFQAARGRYIQVKLVLRGNGRETPWIRAVRAYYPRFSYLERYMPAVYQDDVESAGFTERLLANMEGFNTELEGKIALVSQLFDARTAPPEALDWLAGWLGLVADPVWGTIQARRIEPERVSWQIPAPDRRRLFIRFARRLYGRRGTPEGIRFALHLLLDPCLEETLEAFKAGATRLNPALRDELEHLGLPYPTPVMREDELEDLLYDYVLAPGRPSKVRLVEHYQARDGRALAVGDVTPEARTRENTIAATAHRFSVLVPEQLLPEEAAMVGRVVTLEKPAHTSFTVHRYYDYFRVGEALLGTDSVLGEGGRFTAIALDRDYLAYGYLSPAPPSDTLERFLSDRDRPAERAL